MRLLILEAKLWLASGRVKLLLGGYLLLMIMAVVLGHQRQQFELAGQAELQQHFKQKFVDVQQQETVPDAGYLAYSFFAPAHFTPSPWSALIWGERAEQLTSMQIRLLAIQGQIHGSPLSNTDHFAIGHFDLAFVWLYVLPLLIGLLSVTCLSDDKRMGRWALIASQIHRTTPFAIRRLGVRFLALALINSVFLSFVVLIMNLPIDSTLFFIWLLLMLYQLLWFVLSGWIAVAGEQGSRQLLSYLAIWLASVVVFPGLHYLSSLESQSLNTGINVLMTQRQEMNDSWDKHRNASFQVFLQRHPEWSNTAPLGESFHWKWYYAMQKQSDNTVAESVQQYYQQRSQADSPFKWFSPTLMLQETLKSLADTDNASHQHYLRQITRWHGQLQQFWFPFFFFDETLSKDDWQRFPLFEMQYSEPPSRAGHQGLIYAIAALSVLLLLILLSARLPAIRISRAKAGSAVLPET